MVVNANRTYRRLSPWRSTDLTETLAYGLAWCCMVYVPFLQSTVVLASRLIGSRLWLRLAGYTTVCSPGLSGRLPWPPPREASVTDGACILFNRVVDRSSRLLSHGILGRFRPDPSYRDACDGPPLSDKSTRGLTPRTNYLSRHPKASTPLLQLSIDVNPFRSF